MNLQQLHHKIRGAPSSLEDTANELTATELHFRHFTRYRGALYDEDGFLIDLRLQRCEASVDKATTTTERVGS